jgi:hypothetical protein
VTFIEGPREEEYGVVTVFTDLYRCSDAAEVSGGDHLIFVSTTCVALGVATCSLCR